MFSTETQSTQRKRLLRGLRAFAVYFVLVGLLWWAVRNAPLTDIWKTLEQLQLWQIMVILSIDAVIYLLITARWWFIVRSENAGVSFFSLLAVRVAVFGVSYFTLGPQIGGEPLQVLYLQRNYGLTYTRATASVVMDKLLEFLANFALLIIGLTAIFQAGILARNGAPLLSPAALPQVQVSLIGLVILLLWPVIHIGLMIRGRHPLTAFLRALPFIPQNAKLVRFIRAAEWMAGTFCRRHTSALLSAIFVSALAAAAMVGEYFILTSFLQIHLTFWQTIAAWTAGWLAFLVPLPGGLGALEASQVIALGVFGIRASSAISVTLLMRARDILTGGLGLLLAGNSARRA